MRNHLKRHPLSENPSTPAKKQTTLTMFAEVSKPLSSSHADKITCAIADMVVLDYLPLSFVEGEGFRRLMELAAPGYTVPSRNTIRARIEQRYASEKLNLISELSASTAVAITTDTWTSNATESYITVTSHHITDDWELRGNVLVTREMPERHTGINLAERLQNTVEEFGLDGKVETCVHDNARNMDCAGTMCDGWSDLGCFAHTLQLCIRPALELPSVSKVITRCRKLVGHFRHSSHLMKALQKRQEENKKTPRVPIQDVPTRWNSTFDMIDRLAELRREITDIMHDDDLTKKADKFLLLKDNEWELVDDVSRALRQFKQTTTYMCAERTVSASEVFPVVNGLIRALTPTDDDSAVAAKVKLTLAEEIVTRFRPTCDKTAESVPMLASLLDPRYKKLALAPAHLRKITENILEARMDEAPLSVGRANAEETPSKRPRLDFLVFSPENKKASDELHEYLAERSEDVDPLSWWRRNADRYPRVAFVARRVLAVPATSVPSERVFSSAGLVVNKLRNRLSSDVVDKILFLNKNM